MGECFLSTLSALTAVDTQKLTAAEKKRLRRRCLGLLRLGYPSQQIAEQMAISERTLRRWVALAREEVAADYVIRDGDGAGRQPR